ncbi:hypothetical protein ABIA39_004572 [Nocardia sp. GAS34]
MRSRRVGVVTGQRANRPEAVTARAWRATSALEWGLLR